MKPLLLFANLLLLFVLLQFTACKPQAFELPFENAGGYIIGKERCNTDTTKDYWLIDLSIFPLPNNYGDTLTLNGIRYNHVVKTAELDTQFKFIGARVGFDFYISSSQVNTTNCSVPTPQTYPLKTMDVLNQGEIR